MVIIMKTRLLAFLALSLAMTASATTLEETFDRTFDVRAGTLFALKNTNGRITIHSWDQPRVQVRALKKVDSRDTETAKQVLAELKIEPSLSADGLRINTKYPRRSEGLFDWLSGNNVNLTVQYDVTVPRSMNLDIDNTNGAIDISDVRGSHRIANTNGHIELIRCAGDVDAETTNGALRAELSEVNSGKSIRLTTTNGRIAVVLPKSFAARVDASTTNGSIKTDIPVTTTEFHRHTVRGTINGGGAELRLRTTNGSINIEGR
jgi:DUF4097 and DUF4098 domain-containing protein YvlB